MTSGAARPPAVIEGAIGDLGPTLEGAVYCLGHGPVDLNKPIARGRILVDTGSPHCHVNAQLVRECQAHPGVSPEGKLCPQGAGWTESTGGARQHIVSLGDPIQGLVSAWQPQLDGGAPSLAFDPRRVFYPALFTTPDPDHEVLALVGASVLADWVYIQERGRFRLERGGASPEPTPGILRLEGEVVDGAPYLDGSLVETETHRELARGRVLVDTGASCSLAEAAALEPHLGGLRVLHTSVMYGFNSSAEEAPAYNVGLALHAGRGRIHATPRPLVGRGRFADAPEHLLYTRSLSREGVIAVLGRASLIAWRVVLDGPRRRFWLEVPGVPMPG